METLLTFNQTKMYSILKKFPSFMLPIDLRKFENSSPFWKSDECSYLNFLRVIENEYHHFNSKRLTRNLTLNTTPWIEEITYMLVEHVEDDEVEEENLDKKCVICLFNRSNVKFSCHTVVCQKCYNIMVSRYIKTCPLCKQNI